MNVRAFLMLSVLITGCADRVSVYITGPKELQGAVVYLDGKAISKMEPVETPSETKKITNSEVTGSVAKIDVSIGRHEIKIEREGLRPIVKPLNYSRRGEDYIGVADDEIKSSRSESRPRS